MWAASIWPNILATEFSITWVGDSNWVWNHSIYSVAEVEENTKVTETKFEYSLFYWSSDEVAMWDYKLLLLDLIFKQI